MWITKNFFRLSKTKNIFLKKYLTYIKNKITEIKRVANFSPKKLATLFILFKI